jgi:type IV secretory pathway VirB10-like protein
MRPRHLLTLSALALVAGCHHDAAPARRDAEPPRAPPEAAVVIAVGQAPSGPTLTPVPSDASSPPADSPPPPPPLDAETTRIVTQAREASRRRDFRAACELIARAHRHAPGHPEVRRVARGVASNIEQAYAFERTGPGFYRTVMVCIRQGVPVDMEIFS